MIRRMRVFLSKKAEPRRFSLSALQGYLLVRRLLPIIELRRDDHIIHTHTFEALIENIQKDGDFVSHEIGRRHSYGELLIKFADPIAGNAKWAVNVAVVGEGEVTLVFAAKELARVIYPT